MQKTATKKTIYPRKEIILKMAKDSHNAKAIAQSKYSVRAKK